MELKALAHDLMAACKQRHGDGCSPLHSPLHAALRKYRRYQFSTAAGLADTAEMHTTLPLLVFVVLIFLSFALA
jgi:hypothetical protein